MPTQAPIRALCIVLLAGLLPNPARSAEGAIYKCQGPGKTTVYQQTPCGPGDQPAAIPVHRPTPEEAQAAHLRSQKERAAAHALEQEQAEQRHKAREAAQYREDATRKKRAACAKLQADAEALEQGQRLRSSPYARALDGDRATRLRNKHFSDCFATQ